MASMFFVLRIYNRLLHTAISKPFRLEAATRLFCDPHLREDAARSDIVCRSDKLLDAFSGAKVNDICFSADSFHQACEDSAWADFVEVLDAVGEELLHTFLPEYGVCQLL
jgi:hypothetical protein